jgi:hypothetical protein
MSKNIRFEFETILKAETFESNIFSNPTPTFYTQCRGSLRFFTGSLMDRNAYVLREVLEF